MEFKLTGRAMRTLWQNEVSALCSVQETFSNKGKEGTKTWAVFTNQPLTIGAEYTITGYVTESPNKGFMNEQSKVAYKSNFNATHVQMLGEQHDFGDPPDNQDLENIPF